MSKPDFSWPASLLTDEICQNLDRDFIRGKLERAFEVAYENGKKESVEEYGICFPENVLINYNAEWDEYDVVIVYSNGSTISKNIGERLLCELIDEVLK